MRVLWVSHFLPYPPTGGVLQRGYGLISRLGTSCELHLLAMHQPRLFRQTGESSGLSKEDAINELKKHCSSVETIDIPSEVRPLGRHVAAVLAALQGRSYTEQWLMSSAMQVAVAAAVRRTRADLVHFDTISLAPYSSACRDVRLSLGHHNIESHMMWRRSKNASNEVGKRLLKVEASRILELEKTYAPRMDLNVVCSALDGTRLRRMTGARRIHVAENGVLGPEADSISLSSRALTTRLLFVGRMSAYTNRDAAEFLARDIWPAIAARRPKLTLDIVGSGAPAAAHELATADSRVKVHGFLADLSQVLAPGTIFVCPVRDGGGTKLKILDAMNRGLAIVAHPLALEGIDARDGDHVLLASTPGEFADAIDGLVGSPERRVMLAQNAFQLVRDRYAFDAIADQLYLRFESTLNQAQAA
jgi:glycosyltransferase involved in cell wall biosynthesis